MADSMHPFLHKHRLFILAEPRSGSSWLMETLDSHPGISLQGELLNQAVNGDVAKYSGGGPVEFGACLRYLEKALEAPGKKTARFAGCKVLLNQMTLIGSGFPEFFIDFYRRAVFIFLFRANLVASEVSLQLAHKHDVWHVKREEQVVLKKLRLSPPVLVANLEKRLERREKIRQLLAAKGPSCLAISYEELFGDPSASMGKLFAFLGLADRGVVFSREKKSNPFQHQLVIENYQEVRQYLESYPHFLQMLLAE